MLGFPGSSDGKESACSAGHVGLSPESGRCPGRGHGKLLQYSSLENPMDRGAWWAASPWIAVRHDWTTKFSSVQFTCSVVSDSLWPHESQHASPPCPSPTPGVHSDSRPKSWWYHPAISSSVVPFSSCPQSLPASESFPMSQLFATGGQSIGASASASVLPMNTQDWSPLGWTDWLVLLAVQGTLKRRLQHHSSKASILRCSAFFTVQLSHPYMTTGKTIDLTRRTFVGKVFPAVHIV